MAKTKLKPCPFCGGTPIIIFDNVVKGLDDYYFSIHCTECRAMIMRSMYAGCKSEKQIKKILSEKVSDLWNIRNGGNNENV